jgi:hypothetical protein
MGLPLRSGVARMELIRIVFEVHETNAGSLVKIITAFDDD